MNYKYILLALVLCVLLFVSCSSFKYHSEKIYNDFQIQIDSDKQHYSFGETIPIAVTVLNTRNETISLTSMSKEILNPITNIGLDEPGTVYDLIFVGELVNENGERKEYVWLWSEEKEFNSTELSMSPNERKLLIEYEWIPPTGKLLQGSFFVRFGDAEFPTGISIKSPKR